MKGEWDYKIKEIEEKGKQGRGSRIYVECLKRSVNGTRKHTKQKIQIN
jgi:hypothetical protein